MSKPTKLEHKKTRFTITRSSTMGRYSLKAHNCSLLNYSNGTAFDIADWITWHLALTMRRMPQNNAKEIKITMSWK